MSLTAVHFEKISEGFENESFRDLLAEVLCDGVDKALFRYAKDPVWKEAVLQCHIRHRYGHKFESILSLYPGWLFPPGLPLQQASHHLTAKFKATFAKNFSQVADLTGGLGMDSIAFASETDSVVYIEQNQEIFTYNSHNFHRYLPNVEPILADSLQWIRNTDRIHPLSTLLYADPARRTSSDKQTNNLKSYLPDPFLLSEIANKTSLPLLLKVSPMADLNLLVSAFNGVSEVQLLAVQNELKEILLYHDRSLSKPQIKIWLCESEDAVLLFESDKLPIQSHVEIRNTPLQYLYLPHPALIKARADVFIACQENLKGFHTDARLYTSDYRISLKGWRCFEVIDFASALSHIDVPEAMIVTGKFPEKPDIIRKRHQIPESDSYLLAVTKTGKNENLWILAKKLFL